MPEPSIAEYTVGWIVALQEEFDASCRMLDEELDGPECAEVHDNNTYVFGRIKAHHVVIGCLPGGQYGNNAAAIVARDMIRSFPTLRFALLVGIGGGAPTCAADVRLGDVVVSEPFGTLGGVVQLDLGKQLPDGSFERKGQLDAPPQVLLGVLPILRRNHNDPRKPDRIAEHIGLMDDMPEYGRPAEDRLYRADYLHKGGEDCKDCETAAVVDRSPRSTKRAVTVHYGIIASSNSVVKNTEIRDRYSRELNVLCFEMEAAGLVNNVKCLVIRGICDYCDSHKNDVWHNYAALAASAYAKQVLCLLKPERISGMPPWAERVNQVLTQTSEYIVNQEREVVVEWLTPLNHGIQQHDYMSRRQSGTGQWLLDSGEFQTWEDLPYIDRHQLSSEGSADAPDDKIGLAFVYCDSTRRNDQRPIDMLASLIKQLVQKLPSVPQVVSNLYKKHKEIPASERSNADVAEFSEALQDVITGEYERVFFVVDALDECDGDVVDVFLPKILKVRSATAASLFATSRPVPNIQKKFEGNPLLNIYARDEDVKRYADGRMSKMWVLSEDNGEWSDKEKTQIKIQVRDRVTKAVDGLFLLAKFHLDSLVLKTTRKKILDTLKTLPTGPGAYDQAYAKTIKRIGTQDPERRRVAKRVLDWLVCAERSLTTLELRHALAVQPGATELDEDDVETTGVIVDVCMGLVTIEEGSGVMRLLHPTTLEYLRGNMGCLLVLESPTTVEDVTIFDAETNRTANMKAHQGIAIACVIYLSFNIFESGFCQTDEEFERRLRSNPLYDYAAHNWGNHAREASTLGQEVMDFLECEAKVEAASQALLAIKWWPGHSEYSQKFPRQMTGLHLAAHFGVEEAVKALLQKGVETDAKNTDGRTPLSWAAENGHEAIVQLLLEKGADPNAGDDEGGTALSWAAGNGHEAFVKLLLEKGAEIEAKDSQYGQTPLVWAAKNGHEAVVKLLLVKGNARTEDSVGRTPLLLAAKNGHDTVAMALIRHDSIDLDLNQGKIDSVKSRNALASFLSTTPWHTDLNRSS